MLLSQLNSNTSPLQVVRLWVHECQRVFGDRLVNDMDMAKFNEFRVNVTKKFFDDMPLVGWVRSNEGSREGAALHMAGSS